MATYKLGKLPPKIDKRTLKLSRYLVPAELPEIPESWDWGKAVPNWPMYANDRIGDCAIAGPAHQIQIFHFNANRPWTPPESAVIRAYAEVSGYDPKTGKGDSGCVMLDVMNYWRKTGIADNNISAYVSVNPKNLKQVRTALYLFGGLVAGFGLPNTAQEQEVWDVTDPSLRGQAAPYSWGGHCVLFSAYNPWQAITWGYSQPFTPAFMATYCDELFAVAAKGWIRDDGTAPSGLNWVKLKEDLAKVTG